MPFLYGYSHYTTSNFQTKPIITIIIIMTAIRVILDSVYLMSEVSVRIGQVYKRKIKMVLIK